MLNKERVQAEIAQIAEQYANGLYTKIEALEAMRAAVDGEVNNHFINDYDNPKAGFRPELEGASDYQKAGIIILELKHIVKFKNSISFGDILQHRPL